MMKELIAANKRRSFVLISLMLMVLLVLGVTLGEFVAPGGGGAVGLLVAVAVFIVQWFIYNFSPSSLVMSGMGGRKIEKDECPRLFNIVEEMQLASGLEKMPEVWLVDTPTPNAFAYSDGRGNAAVAATTGLLWRLNRDELQGVMAHEVAHIVNRDVRFMTLAGVILGSIVILSDMARRTMLYGGRGASRARSSGTSGGGAQAIAVILLVAVAIAGPFLAQLLYFAISRKREYLADAAATVYTRYPEGLASALEKIQAHATGMPGNRVAHAMCIIPPMAAEGESESLSSTHPPTSKRIAILRSMGSSAGLAAYENAARRSLGDSSMLPAGALAEASQLQVRAPSDEGPIMTRPGSREQAHIAQAFSVIDCSCSMQIRIPPNYERANIRCIRCSTDHPVSSARIMTQESIAARRISNRPDSVYPLILCHCGHYIKVRPSQTGSTVLCDKCGAGHSPSLAKFAHEQQPEEYQVPTPTPGEWNRFPCPNCNMPIEISPNFLGSQYRCRGCGSMMKMS